MPIVNGGRSVRDDDREVESEEETVVNGSARKRSPSAAMSMQVDSDLTKANGTHSGSRSRSSSSPGGKASASASPRRSASTMSDEPAASSSKSPGPVFDEPPTPSASARKKKAAPGHPVQLIGDLPVARQDALKTFNEIHENWYQNKQLGRHRELGESMTCECTYKPGDDPEDACGSECINRLTLIECQPDSCRCKKYCQNQRFQKREYAKIEVVQTEKKGFGLRAEEFLPKGSFIYEYVGDVVSPAKFRTRMKDYAEEGIEHFYFMMLQKDEFIDATKSGGLGRFANHSCSPNCGVDKWTVGPYVRMGIFAKRDIQKHEELTFNYNVDRYGHQAQTCYCGEPNCVGFIGGKTQTEGDLVTLDDLYLDALGIDDDDFAAAKGSKKKRGKKLDDPDFLPQMKPVAMKDAATVIRAIRQTASKKVLYKIMTRIKITEDAVVFRQIMRLRVFSLMHNILEEYKDNFDIVRLALECLEKMPLIAKNKVEDSKIEVPVRAVSELEGESEDMEGMRGIARKLLDHWAALTSGYRIPKRNLEDVEQEDLSGRFVAEQEREARRAALYQPSKQRRMQLEAIVKVEEEEEKKKKDKDKRKEVALKTPNASEYKKSVGDLIERAKREAEEAERKRKEEEERVKEETERKKKEKEERRERRRREKEERAKRKEETPEEKERNKEKRLRKLVGAVVVKCMNKHQRAMDKEMFKRHAQELTQIIVEKEKKSGSYKANKLDTLSEEKTEKIRKFAKEYVAKILRKMDKKRRASGSGSRGPEMTPGTSSTHLATPDTPTPREREGEGEEMMAMSVDGEDDDGGEGGANGMSVEEAMGMDKDDDDFSEDSEDEREKGGGRGHEPPPKKTAMDVDAGDEPMEDVEPPPAGVNGSDPRRRLSEGDGDGL